MIDPTNRINGAGGAGAPQPGQAGRPGTEAGEFEKLLRQQRIRQQSRQAQQATPQPQGGLPLDPAQQAVAFSKHAQQRLDQRSITLAPDQSARLESAIDSAAGKGARQSLVYLDGMAFVVNVADRKVITALSVEPGQSAAQNVFTNIDSAVLA